MTAPAFDSARAPYMYTELAAWFPLVSPPQDYAEEAVWYVRAIKDAAERAVECVLELGSGGGNNASHLKHHFELTLIDPSAGMLDVSRALNPECEHIVGDMRTVRLGCDFDAVFIHDAILYMTSVADLEAALTTAFAHCRPGGVVLVAPDFVRETFAPGTSHGGHDAPDGRGLRYLEWTWDPDPNDETYTVDFAFLLREADGRVRSVSDRHVCGLFACETWRRALESAGFHPHNLHDAFDHDVFIGVRPM